MKKNLWQLIKFALVGVMNTLCSEIIYAVLIYFRMHYLPASFIGFSLSVLNAYYWSNKYVFKEEEDGEKRVWWKVLIKTYIAYLGGYILSAVLLILWIDIVNISQYMGPIADWFASINMTKFDAKFLGELLAAAINLMITVPLNFVMNKYWAYKQKARA